MASNVVSCLFQELVKARAGVGMGSLSMCASLSSKPDGHTLYIANVSSIEEKIDANYVCTVSSVH